MLMKLKVLLQIHEKVMHMSAQTDAIAAGVTNLQSSVGNLVGIVQALEAKVLAGGTLTDAEKAQLDTAIQNLTALKAQIDAAVNAVTAV